MNFYVNFVVWGVVIFLRRLSVNLKPLSSFGCCLQISRNHQLTVKRKAASDNLKKCVLLNVNCYFFLAISRDHKAVGRRPFDKMATLLAYLGPPEHKPVADTHWSSLNLTSSKFEEFMTR